MRPMATHPAPVEKQTLSVTLVKAERWTQAGRLGPGELVLTFADATNPDRKWQVKLQPTEVKSV